MKNIVSIILIAWSISSCSDCLDVQPKTAIPADKLFETESGFRDALTGFYLKMTDIGLYGKELSYGYSVLFTGSTRRRKRSLIERLSIGRPLPPCPRIKWWTCC